MFAVLQGANENNYTLHFRNLCALLKLTICTGVAFDAIKVTLNSNQTHYLSGTGTIDYNNNIITISSGNDNVTLALPQGHVGNPLGESFYIMVPEFKIGNNGHQNSLVIEIMYGNTVVKTYTKNLVQNNSILANHIYQIQTLSFDNTISKVFSVSTNKTVVFAPGNLQWSYTNGGTDPTTHSTNGAGYNKGTWRFAPNQYDIIGTGNTNAMGNASGEYTQTSYTGWFDLFPWGGSGYGDSRPFWYANANFHCDNTVLGNYDWGAFNAIYNPKTRNIDPYGIWRTLSPSEWNYLLYNRGSGAEAWCRYSVVNIDFQSNLTIPGLIIYPDNTTFSTVQSIISSILTTDINANSGKTISKNEFDQLEELGCAFVPCAGAMKKYSVLEIDPNNGYYWSYSARISEPQCYPNYLYFTCGGGLPQIIESGYVNANVNFHSVRLVRDVN